jgi:TPR repeat protein
LALGATFDPELIKHLGAIGEVPDIAQARVWYEKAAELGAPAAAQQLANSRRRGEPGRILRSCHANSAFQPRARRRCVAYTAKLFLDMLTFDVHHRALLGVAAARSDEIDRLITDAVDIFLNGAKYPARAERHSD